MLNVLNVLYTYLSSLLLIDFSNYTGPLPEEVLFIYSYFSNFFKLTIIFYFLYLCFNFVIFIISLGGVRHDK